jgi:hypothetical protein
VCRHVCDCACTCHGVDGNVDFQSLGSNFREKINDFVAKNLVMYVFVDLFLDLFGGNREEGLVDGCPAVRGRWEPAVYGFR